MSLFSKPKGKHAQGSNTKKDEAPVAPFAVSPGDDGVDSIADVVSGEQAEGAAADEAPAASAIDGGGGAPDSGDAGKPAEAAEEAVPVDAEPIDEGGAVAGGIPAEFAVEPTADDAGGFVAAGFGEIPSKKRRLALKVVGITVGVLACVALVAYIVGAAVFMGRFLPNTRVGDYDISLKTDAEVAELLEGIVGDYQLDVLGGGFAYRTTGEGIGLTIDSAGIIAAMHEDEGCWEWPLLIAQPAHDETARLAIEFKPSVYEDDVIAAVEKFNEGAKAPVNATIAYDEKADKFIVKPEEAGTQLDVRTVLDSMATAIEQLDEKVELGEEQLVQPSVLATDEKLIEAAELASGMVSAKLALEIGGQPAGEVDGETLSQFITIDDDFEVIFREEEMNAWVDSLAAGFDTVGTERAYTRADGKQVSVPAGGSYGWETDTAALKDAVLEGIKSGAKTTIEVPCVSTAAVYNGIGQRDWGNRYLDVDVTEQHVRFYGDDGAIIWEQDCISGSPDGKHDTVPGTWYVNNKESPSKLIGYENGKKIYETSVTYWMPFEGNSIGFHDATWQPSFGGSMYRNGYGSHGCVNLSYDGARSLYDIIQVGDVVVVHY